MKTINVTFYGQNVWGWGKVAGDNRINTRNYGIKAMINAYNADICCFQECTAHIVRGGDAAIEGLLADRYEEVPTAAEKKNFTPVFYRRDRFNVIESGFTLFEGLNDVNSKSITFAVFEEKESGVRFAVLSTHFWWQAGGETDNKQRMENAARLIEQMSFIKEKYGVPVFVEGDFNCGKNSPQGEEPYRFLCEHLKDARKTADITTDEHTHHAGPKCGSDNIYYAVEPEHMESIDHFFWLGEENVHIDSFRVDNSAVSLSTSDHSPIIVKATIDG